LGLTVNKVKIDPKHPISLNPLRMVKSIGSNCTTKQAAKSVYWNLRPNNWIKNNTPTNKLPQLLTMKARMKPRYSRRYGLSGSGHDYGRLKKEKTALPVGSHGFMDAIYDAAQCVERSP